MAQASWARTGARLVMAAGLAFAIGCGGGAGKKDADSADDAASAEGKGASQASWSGSLEPGTPVCIGGSAGVRYVLEDALTERSLEIADQCLAADVEFEETGDTGAWELKYRAVGEEWQSCKSQEQEREAFLGECLGSLGAQIGGGDA